MKGEPSHQNHIDHVQCKVRMKYKFSSKVPTVSRVHFIGLGETAGMRTGCHSHISGRREVHVILSYFLENKIIEFLLNVKQIICRKYGTKLGLNLYEAK
jgi:membrane protease subunit (stomatin/prohibitin family)